VLDVFVCHAPADREVAAAVAARLERGAEARVWLDEDSRQTVAASWDGGLSSAGILMLLSPDSVPARSGRAPWEALLKHLDTHADPPVASLLVRECGYPPLLERKLFFRWGSNAIATLRELERWVIGLHAPPGRPSFSPARLPWFEGRGDELRHLWERLVDSAGCVALVNPAAASGKTALAQEFARQAGDHFRDVLWVDCGGRTRAAIAGDLAAQLGVALEGPLERALEYLGPLAVRHRVLLILDGLEGPLPWSGRPEGLASVLITARRAPQGIAAIPLEATQQAPIVPPENDADRRLWNAMAACSHGGFPLALASRAAGIETEQALQAYRRLVAARLADPFDTAGPRARLNAVSRAAADPAPFARRHAEALLDGPPAELETAIAWASIEDWPLAAALTRRAVALLQNGHRSTAAIPLLENLRSGAAARGDTARAEYADWDLSWIEERPVLGMVSGEQLTLNF